MENKEIVIYKKTQNKEYRKIYKLIMDKKGGSNDKLYKEINEIIFNYYKFAEKNYFNAFIVQNYVDEYLKVINHLLEKYNEEYNKTIYDISSFISLYTENNLKYKYYVIDEFKKIGIIEERNYQDKKEINAFKKILQVLSVTYRKDNKNSPHKIYNNSNTNIINQKAKKIVNLIIELNKKSKLINQIEVVKPTNSTMETLCVLPDIVVDNENDFKQLIDKLFKLLWDNNQKIRVYDKNKELSFINSLRTYYYHDIDHGKEKDIRKKFINVKNIYKKACGKVIIETSKDWQKLQIYVYDQLIIFLSNVDIEENSGVLNWE